MSAEYQVWIADRFGRRLGVLERLQKLSYSRIVNAVGSFTVTVPRDELRDELVSEDMRIEVWRKPEGGVWQREGDSAWLLQSDTRGVSDKDGQYRRIKAVTANHLLSRRLIAANPASPNAAKYAPADDVMKAYVDENLGATAGTVAWNNSGSFPTITRSWTTMLTVQPLISAAAYIDKDASWRNLLTTLQEIARSASLIDLTKPLFFDVVWGVGTLEFRTYIVARGQDRTGSVGHMVLSPERGNLGGTVEVTTDWEDSASLVYAGGRGQGDARLMSAAKDDTLIGHSPWGLREAWIDATQSKERPDRPAGSALTPEAQAELRRKRPQKTLTGTILSTRDALYGVHWGWGDLVKAEFDGDSFLASIDRVTVTVDKGEEKIQAGFTATDATATTALRARPHSIPRQPGVPA